MSLFSISKTQDIDLNHFLGDYQSLSDIVLQKRKGQYVYLLKPSEYIKSGQNIYKIGHTERFLYERVIEYGPGTQLINFREVEHSHQTEKLIIHEFEKKGIKPIIGKREYFKDRLIEINNEFDRVSRNCLPLNSLNLFELYKLFTDRLWRLHLTETYYNKIQVYLPNLITDSEKRELSMLRLKQFFIDKIRDMDFDQRYKFAESLDIETLDVHQSIKLLSL